VFEPVKEQNYFKMKQKLFDDVIMILFGEYADMLEL
jgi:hypothetical protein